MNIINVKALEMSKARKVHKKNFAAVNEPYNVMKNKPKHIAYKLPFKLDFFKALDVD